MLKHKIGLLPSVLLSAFFTLGSTETEACSRITWNTEQGVFVSRTFDWLESLKPGIENYPKGFEYTRSLRPDAAKETSAFAVTAITSYGGLVGEGVNEQGLSGNLLFFNEMDINERPAADTLGHAKLLQHILSQYSSVEEAVAAMKNMEMFTDAVPGVPVTMNLHLSLQDVSGDSAIFEWQEKELKIFHGPEYNVMTNSPEFQKHLANLDKYSAEWGPLEQQTSLTNLHTGGNTHSADRFIHNVYFSNHLKEPSSIANGLMKLESVVYKIPHDAPNLPNAELGGVITGYATELVVTQHLESGETVLNYTWGDVHSLSRFNYKKLQETGQRLRFDATQADLMGDITQRIIDEGKI